MAKDVVVVDKLSKRFNGVLALNGVSLIIKEGEIFGLLGPNGAGKTTLISILSTLRAPDSGTASLNGFDVVHDSGRVRGSIGVVFQESILDLDLTAYDNLDFHARIYKIPSAAREKLIRNASLLVGLENDLKRRVSSFSGGMKRRLEIARGMLNTPRVLFLDEPTLGLDPQARRRVWRYLRHLREKERVTILLTTHYMEEADYLCDRIAIIDRGKIVASGSPSDLKKRARGHRPTLEDAFLSYTGKGIRDDV